jgi:hypothetical protein
VSLQYITLMICGLKGNGVSTPFLFWDKWCWLLLWNHRTIVLELTIHLIVNFSDCYMFCFRCGWACGSSSLCRFPSFPHLSGAT